MKKSFGFWQFVGFLFVSATGTLLHFLYDWSNQSVFVGLFSAVNESTWEHMKLLYFPLLAYAVFERFVLKRPYEYFWSLKLLGIFAGLMAIPVLFYSYTGVFGISVDWFNITIFFIATAVSFGIELLLFKSKRSLKLSGFWAISVICLIGVLFWVFTFSPPVIPLFKDPLSATFGINTHT